MSDGIALSLEQLLRPPTLAQLLPSRQVSGRRTGMHQASSKGRGMEFAEVRPYLSGDDVRSIDWRITARTGKPHTKLFREERDRSVYTLLDLDPTLYFGSRGQLKARLATILAAATAWQALGEGDKVGGLILLGAEPIRHPPAGRRKDLLLWLQKLLQAYQAGQARPDNLIGMTEGLKLLSRTVRPGSLIHVISDFYHMDDTAWLWLKRLNKSHQVYGYQVVDRLEVQLIGQGTLAADNGRQQGFLTSHDPQFVRHYRQVGMHRQHSIARQLRESTLRYYCLDTSRPTTAGREEAS